jgi:D-arabinose 1-dehydrogenase-like Zn-dependent alcohol dehydrogenase
LRKGGRLVIAGATAGPEPTVNLRRVFWNQLSIVGSTMGSDAEVSDMLRAVAGMKLEPVIDSTYGFSEARAALERLASGEHFGKIVLVP